MLHSLYTAATGLEAQQTNMDVISNNLANVNTTGFKTARAVFQDLLYQNMTQPGGQSSQTGTAHQPLHAGSTDATPVPPQGGVNAGRAVAAAALGMDQPDVLGQLAIGDRPLALGPTTPSVVSAG